MIYSCKGCVAPKRYPGCHAVCQEYLEQKAAYDERKAELDKEQQIKQAILGDRGVKVYNAMKGYRHSKYRER
jgi:hypothetical protein